MTLCLQILSSWNVITGTEEKTETVYKWANERGTPAGCCLWTATPHASRGSPGTSPSLGSPASEISRHRSFGFTSLCLHIFENDSETGIAASATFLPRESMRCVSAGVQGVGPKAGRVGGGHRGWLGARHDSLGLQMSAQRPGAMKAPRPGWQPEAHESPVGFEVHGVAFLM